MLTLMKTGKAKHRKEHSARAEVGRAIKVVTFLLIALLLMFGWKQLVLPTLLSGYVGTPYEGGMNSILLIMGAMAALLLLLFGRVISVEIKLSNLTRKVLRIAGKPQHIKSASGE